VRLGRAYDAPSAEDGQRILVDRLWPRGLAKQAARIDHWAKAATPSDALRRWYHGPEATYEQFVQRYEAELAEPGAVQELERLRALAQAGAVTLLTAVKEPDRSHAAVLARHLREGEHADDRGSGSDNGGGDDSGGG
jgi:uncharacterized protein YeaO (DUF488 family)